MRRSLAILLVLVLFACGGEETPSTTPEGGDGTGNGGGDLAPLKVPPPDQNPSEPEPEPEPLDPQAAIFSKAEGLMKSSDAEDRAMAIVVLRDADDQNRAGRYVARLLFDRDEDVRSVAAEAIGQLAYPPGAENLRTLLVNEKSSYVRKTAIVSLYALADKGALADCIQLLENDDEGSVRATAAGLLGRIGSNDAVDPLIEAVKNEFDDSVLLQALVALRKIGSRKAADVAIEALEFSGVLVRTEAARALGELGDKKAIGPLVRMLSPEEDTQALSAAVTSLVKLTGATDEALKLDGEASVEEQNAAITAWKKWWEENGSESGD